MTPVKKILVGTDYSEDAEEAVAEGVRLAAEHGARLVLAHALAPPESPVLLEGGRDYYLKRLRDQLATAEARREAAGTPARVEASFEVLEGFAPAELSRLAREVEADLLLVATHGRTGLRRLLLGSVAEKIMRIAETDVLVVRHRTEPRGPFQRILVPTDFTAPAERALERALALAAPGSVVELFHAWQLEEHTERADLRAEVERAGEELASRFATERAELVFTHREDTPVRAISERLGEDPPCGLVALGSHGRRGLRRLLLGSVAEATVRYSPCSALIAR